MDPSLVEMLEALERLLARPPGDHLGALGELRSAWPSPAVPEAWNTAFGPGSLFEAWTATPFMRSIYAANAAELHAVLRRDDFVVAEIGGGNGALWQEALGPGARGTLVLVDPEPEAHVRVQEVLPSGVALVSRPERVEDVSLPEVDAIVCSLTLHHVAGEDAARRARFGLAGPGKAEILAGFATALAPRGGRLLLNEADVYCDLALPPGDPVLADRIVDSYVRRCARGLIAALRDPATPSALAARWAVIVRRWCVDQLDVVTAAPAARDVYELDVARWLDLLDGAGFDVLAHRFTDRWGLFHQYVAVPRTPR
ncbi:MAG: class I SAM-dependent methyltransferase [Alphaproteobacteria bacterium]|nr:class I SAM-dependent methyltransferase [Alphaproteobacteria bacterium]